MVFSETILYEEILLGVEDIRGTFGGRRNVDFFGKNRSRNEKNNFKDTNNNEILLRFPLLCF